MLLSEIIISRVSYRYWRDCFGVVLGDKIPTMDLIPVDLKVDLEGIRDRDAVMKEKGREYGDKRVGAKLKNIEIGDLAFIPERERINFLLHSDLSHTQWSTRLIQKLLLT